MASLALGTSDHLVFSVFIDFLSNLMGDIPFHCAAFDCSHANCHNRCHQLILFMGRLLGAYTKACEKEKKSKIKDTLKTGFLSHWILTLK